MSSWHTPARQQLEGRGVSRLILCSVYSGWLYPQGLIPISTSTQGLAQCALGEILFEI